MAAKFSATALPAVPTARRVVELWRQRKVEHGSWDDTEDEGEGEAAPKDPVPKHTAFILRRRYTHHPLTVHLIMRDILQHHASSVAEDLAQSAPLDPSEFLIVHNPRGFSLPLLHHLYHRYPTCPVDMNRALRTLLHREEWDAARALIECGGDPRPYEWSSGIVLGGRAARIVEEWTEKRSNSHTCSCGWRAPLWKLQEQSPFVKELHRLRLKPSSRLLFKAAPDPSADQVNPLWYHIRNNIGQSQYRLFRLPVNGELGRNWCPKDENLGDTERTLRRIYNPNRVSDKRHTFLMRGVFEYSQRLWAIFGSGEWKVDENVQLPESLEELPDSLLETWTTDLVRLVGETKALELFYVFNRYS